MDSRPFDVRFFAMVDKHGVNGCWLWTGGKDWDGYGITSYQGTSKRATHATWFLATGEWPERGSVMCHHCDNPPCVNPAHLYVGTIQSNAADMMRRGRQAGGERHWSRKYPEHFRATRKAPPPKKGEAHGNAKLTEVQVREIRALRENGHTLREIAENFGVSRALIGYIVKRVSWRHVE